jgi:hypothetical protein
MSLATTAALVLVTLGARSARADGFMGYEPFSGKIVFQHTNDHLEVQSKVLLPGVDKSAPGGKSKTQVPSSYSVNVGKPVQAVWLSTSKEIERVLPTILAKEYVKGVSAYDVKVNLQKTGKMECWVSGANDQLSIRYTLTGNSVAASLTTPDLVDTDIVKFGLGKYADPRIELTFDVQITIGVKFQLHQAPVVNGVKAVILNAKLKPQNLAGDLLNGANELVKFVGGPDFKAKAEGMLNGNGYSGTPDLTKAFAKADQLVAVFTRDAKSMTTKFDGKEVVVSYSALPPKKVVVK